MHRTRRTQTLLPTRGAQIEIEYNPRRPSIWTIVHQVEALGYMVLVRPFQGRREENSQGFTSQRVGAHLLLIYPPSFDHQRNEEEIAREQNNQLYIESVEVEITEDPFKNCVIPLISRGNNKLAPERIRWAHGSPLHIIWRVSGGKERRPTLLSNTQSKALKFNPPKYSHITYCARRRVVPPWKSRIWLRVPHL